MLANTSVKNMHLLGVEEEKIPGAVEMWVANEEKNIDMIRIFDGIERTSGKTGEKRKYAWCRNIKNTRGTGACS